MPHSNTIEGPVSVCFCVHKWQITATHHNTVRSGTGRRATRCIPIINRDTAPDAAHCTSTMGVVAGSAFGKKKPLAA